MPASELQNNTGPLGGPVMTQPLKHAHNAEVQGMMAPWGFESEWDLNVSSHIPGSSSVSSFLSSACDNHHDNSNKLNAASHGYDHASTVFR